MAAASARADPARRALAAGTGARDGGGELTGAEAEELQPLLAEQVDYYRARAGEYDEWWLRLGRYDHGEDANRRWFAEAGEVRDALQRFGPSGRVLELACGTGIWTEILQPVADELTAVDASAEMLARCRRRLGDAAVRYVQADLFEWEPDHHYDVCFFAFWLSHVPEALLGGFLAKVARALAPGGRLFFIDSASSEQASARDHAALATPGGQTMQRRLNDGRRFTIVKHWFEPDALEQRLTGLGWDIRVAATERFFVYGSGRPTK